MLLDCPTGELKAQGLCFPMASVDQESGYSLGEGDASGSVSQRLASWDKAHSPTASVGCRTGPLFFADSYTEATLSCSVGLSLG